jgi:hypothetical protein
MCDTLLDRLAQHLQYVAVELRQFIQQEHAMVRQRHLARHRDLTAADRAHSRDGVMGGTKRAGGDEGGAGLTSARDAVNARGLNGFGQGHRRQEGGEPPGQPRLARSEWIQEQDVGVTTSAFGSPEHAALDDVPAHGPPPTSPKPARLTALYSARPA